MELSQGGQEDFELAEREALGHPVRWERVALLGHRDVFQDNVTSLATAAFP